MEAVFLNSQFKTAKIIDAFSSFIWTDRYCGYGDFELRLPMSDSALAGVKLNDYVCIRESQYHMIVEGININITNESSYVTITGRSLESILERRFVWEDYIIDGSLQDGILRLLNTEIINPKIKERQVVQLGFLKSEDPAITSLKLTYEVKAGDNLYDVIYDICANEHLGFKIIPQDNGSMLFTLYKGIDRSYRQDKNVWVIFSPNFENLKSTEMDMDTSELKNFILSRSEYTERIEVPTGDDEDEDGELDWTTIEEDVRLEATVGEELSGLERREIFKRSNEKPESIDSRSYGEPEDRVDITEFSSYEVIYFDSEGYKEAVDKFDAKANSLYRPAVEGHWETTSVQLKPGDEGYVPELEGIGQSKPVGVYVHGTTPEEFEKNNRAYRNYVENNAPDKNDFSIYGWVLTDRAGYQRALQDAASEIAGEIMAAVNAKREKVKQLMKTDAEIELSDHLSISTFEGDLDPRLQHQFGVDYYLGDEVQIVNEYNFQAVTRVVAMVYSEEEGVGYVQSPTFESDDKAVFDL